MKAQEPRMKHSEEETKRESDTVNVKDAGSEEAN